MSELVRRIDRARWDTDEADSDEFFSADAITCDLKTTQNALSVWEVGSVDQSGQAVLAMVAQFKDIADAIDVVLLSPEYLYENGIEYAYCSGLTPVKDLVETHVDVTDLTYVKLGVVARHIRSRISANHWRRYTLEEQVSLLRQAIGDKRLSLESVNKNYRRLIQGST